MTSNINTQSATAEFNSFSAASIKFLAALAKNNKREWFQPRKPEFEEVLHRPLIHFAERVNGMLEKEAPAYAHLEPAKALNRIYRDIRFSTDKAPYQNHVSMLFPHSQLNKKSGAALYFSLSASEVMIAAGMYFGETRELQAIREHLAAKHLEFRKLLASKPLVSAFGELSGDSLQKCPKQFGADHPAADFLKRKQWLLMTTRPAKFALEEGFGAESLKMFRLLIPFVNFLNTPLQGLSAKNSGPLL